MKRTTPKHSSKTSKATEPKAEANSTFEAVFGDVPVGASVSLELALAEPASTVEVALSELDESRYVTARVQGVNADTVKEYSERMTEGDVFPAVELFRDETGALWLADGAHRVQAARKNGFSSILAKVGTGGKLAALKRAAGANESHGLRRTPEDKRNAVLMLLADPEINKLTSRPIAELARVSHTFVQSVRDSVGVDSNSPKEDAKGKKYSAKKGTKAKKSKPAIKSDRAIKLARRGLDQVAKDWPLADDRALFFSTVREWLAEHDGTSTKAPTAEAAE